MVAQDRTNTRTAGCLISTAASLNPILATYRKERDGTRSMVNLAFSIIAGIGAVAAIVIALWEHFSKN